MKPHKALTIVVCLLIATSSEAQFFKKLKKAAENAAERTIMNRTDEEVSKGTDQAIDSITKGGKGKKSSKENPKQIGETEKNLDSSTQQNKAKEAAMQKKMAGLFGGGDLKGVPDVYAFSYKATMKITSQKDEAEIHYWMETGQGYFGTRHNDGKVHSLTVMDMENQIMVMFTDDGERKTAMKMPAGKNTIEKLTKKMEEKNKSGAEDIKIVPIEDKNILGYHCKGYQITSKEGISKLWVTDEAPVGYLGGLVNTEDLPNSVLPIGENTMFMEMQFESAKKKKDNFSMLCTELKEEGMSIIKKEYSIMGGF